MKNMIVLSSSLLLTSTANAYYNGLDGEEYDAGVPGYFKPDGTTTYRIYALFSNAADQLVGIGGDFSDVMYAQTNSMFYQNALGGDTEHNAALDLIIPGLHYDTYWTIGSTDSTTSHTQSVWTTGPYWTPNSFLGDDGGYAQVPTDPATFGVWDGYFYRVMIGQFTIYDDGSPLSLEIGTKIAYLPMGGQTIIIYDTLFIPSPGGLALFGLIGLASRRRRYKHQ